MEEELLGRFGMGGMPDVLEMETCDVDERCRSAICSQRRCGVKAKRRKKAHVHVGLPQTPTLLLFLLDVLPLLLGETLGNLTERAKEGLLVFVPLRSEDGSLLASTDLDGVRQIWRRQERPRPSVIFLDERDGQRNETDLQSP
jgi:hypothetical protein